MITGLLGVGLLSGENIGYDGGNDNETAADHGSDVQHLPQEHVSEDDGEYDAGIVIDADFCRRSHAVGIGEGYLAEAAEYTDEDQKQQLFPIRHDEVINHERDARQYTECGKVHYYGHAVHLILEIGQQRVRDAGKEGAEKCHEQRE